MAKRDKFMLKSTASSEWEARSSFKDKATENWESLMYNFCEH